MADRKTTKPTARETRPRERAGRSRMRHTHRAPDLPYIVLMKGQEYSCFRFDVPDRDLSSEALEKIEEILYRFIQANKGTSMRRTIWWKVSPTSGLIPDMELSKARELAGEIAKIVRDPKNHIPSEGGAAMKHPSRCKRCGKRMSSSDSQERGLCSSCEKPRRGRPRLAEPLGGEI